MPQQVRSAQFISRHILSFCHPMPRPRIADYLRQVRADNSAEVLEIQPDPVSAAAALKQLMEAPTPANHVEYSHCIRRAIPSMSTHALIPMLHLGWHGAVAKTFYHEGDSSYENKPRCQKLRDVLELVALPHVILIFNTDFHNSPLAPRSLHFWSERRHISRQI